MKKILSLSVLLIACLSVNTAFAEGDQYDNDPSTSVPTLGGYSWTIGGGASFGGFGEIAGVGDELNLSVIKEGGSTSDLVLGVGGDLCGPDCQSGSFQFNAAAYEYVTTSGTVTGSTSDSPIALVNQGSSAVLGQFQFNAVQLPAPSE